MFRGLASLGEGGNRTVDLFGFDRGEIADRSVGAFRVEPVHSVQGVYFDVFCAPPGIVHVDQFGLVETDLRLREGVVVGVADGSHRGVLAGGEELFVDAD